MQASPSKIKLHSPIRPTKNSKQGLMHSAKLMVSTQIFSVKPWASPLNCLTCASARRPARPLETLEASRASAPAWRRSSVRVPTYIEPRCYEKAGFEPLEDVAWRSFAVDYELRFVIHKATRIPIRNTDSRRGFL